LRGGVAGIEPVPWKPEINKLNAVENNLRSIHERINRVLTIPPEPFTPSPNVNGAVGRLSAMENQLLLLNGLVFSVMDEVLQIPPDP
jgi:16S rRNA A1518/A1519 N6-dimethyltransferase RsmA/KsgA/DIM1 with predicted DNA glycosylase/AP lyase activity